MSKLYTTSTAALKAVTIDSNVINTKKLMIYPGGEDKSTRKNILELINETVDDITELQTKNYAYTDAENTFTATNRFDGGIISNGDIVLNDRKLLLVNNAAIEVYPGEDIPAPEGGFTHLHYYALYKEMTEKLVHNGIYHLNEMESINFALEEEPNDLFSCEVVFTSGATPTTLTADSRIKWFGDNISNGVFIPVANIRYLCTLRYDGVFVRATVSGISIS